jgi:hypothetical protein
MARRNSPNDIQDLNDLRRLGEIVIDKRRGQRAAAKKNRRNRHYENQFIRNTLAHQPLMTGPHADEADADADKSSESAAPDLLGETP